MPGPNSQPQGGKSRAVPREDRNPDHRGKARNRFAKLKARKDAKPADGGGYTYHTPGSMSGRK